MLTYTSCASGYNFT